MARRLFTCALAALLGSAPALAPRADDGAQLRASFGEEVEVVGKRPRGAAADPTAAATVVDASRFAGEAKSVAELVATAPGVAVNGYGGLGQLATISLRGSNADQVQVFLDGLPLNTGAGGGVDLSRIPRAWIQRIEVVRGAEGAVYGLGALGGAVNIVTRPAVAGAWSVETGAGSLRTFQGAVDGAVGGAGWGLLGAVAAESTSGRFDYLFDATRNDPGDPLLPLTRDHDAAATAGGLVKGWARLGSGHLEAVLQLSGGHRDLPGTPANPTPANGQRDSRFGLVARLAQPVGDGLDLRLSAAARDDRLTIWLAPFAIPQRDRQVEAAAELAWSAGANTVTLRASGSAEGLDVEGAQGRSRTGVSLALSDELDLAGGRLRLSPAVRWDALGAYHGASAKLGASAQVAGPVSVRASAGRTFRPPSFAELYLSQGFLSPNPALAPESSWSGDLGLVAAGGGGLAAITGFTQQYQDLVVYEPDSFRRFKPFNDGKAQARGIELELASAPFGPLGLAASGAYTLLVSETLRGEEAVLGKALPHRARHRLFARLASAVGALGLHGEANHVSEAYQDLRSSPGLRVAPVTTFTAGGSVRLARRPDARLSLELRNLLDDRTIEDGFGNPLPGRVVMITLRVAGGKDAP